MPILPDLAATAALAFAAPLYFGIAWRSQTLCRNAIRQLAADHRQRHGRMVRERLQDRVRFCHQIDRTG